MTDHCTVVTNNSIEKFEERRSTLNIKNSARRDLLRLQVDGCLIVTGKRCDWLLIDKKTNTEIFIELKGADVDEGIKQICTSVEVLSKNPKKKFGYVVCTRCPISSPGLQKLQKALLKSHSMTLRVRSRIHTEDIEALV